MSEADKKELEYLADLIERGKRGERVELTFCDVSTRLYCILKRAERQAQIEKWNKEDTEKAAKEEANNEQPGR